MFLIIVLITITSAFAWGSRESPGSGSSGSSKTLTYTINSSYGPWIEGATRCNTRSVPAETTWIYSYSFTNEVSASAGFSVFEIESSVGVKQGVTETKTAEMKTTLQPLDTVKAMYRPVFTNYSVTSGATYAGSAKTLADVDIMIYDVYR